MLLVQMLVARVPVARVVVATPVVVLLLVAQARRFKVTMAVTAIQTV